MTNILLEGFDLYATGAPTGGNPWSVTGVSAFTFVTANAITGTRSAALGSNGSAQRPLGGSYPDLFIGFAGVFNAYPTVFNSTGFGVAGPSGRLVFTLSNLGMPVINRVANNGIGTTLFTGTTPVSLGVKFYAEIRCTGNLWFLRVNGVEIGNGALTDIGAMDSLIYITTATNPARWLMDDLYVNSGTGLYNNTYWGEVSVVALFPSTVSSNVGWAPVGAADPVNILKNVPPIAARHVDSSTAGDIARYTVDALPPNSFEIFTVSVVGYADKSTVAAAEMSQGVRQNGVDAMSVSIPLAENTPTWRYTSIERDPDTGQKWNPGTFAPLLAIERTV